MIKAAKNFYKWDSANPVKLCWKLNTKKIVVTEIYKYLVVISKIMFHTVKCAPQGWCAENDTSW